MNVNVAKAEKIYKMEYGEIKAYNVSPKFYNNVKSAAKLSIVDKSSTTIPDECRGVEFK